MGAGCVGWRKDGGMIGTFSHITAVQPYGSEEMSAAPESREETRPWLLHLKSSVYRQWGRGDKGQAHFSLVQPTTHHTSEPMASQLSVAKAPVGFLKTG